MVYTLCRIPTVENSPSPFTVYTRGFDAIETPDPLTVVFKTTNPTPLLPEQPLDARHPLGAGLWRRAT